MRKIAIAVLSVILSLQASHLLALEEDAESAAKYNDDGKLFDSSQNPSGFQTMDGWLNQANNARSKEFRRNAKQAVRGIVEENGERLTDKERAAICSAIQVWLKEEDPSSIRSATMIAVALKDEGAIPLIGKIAESGDIDAIRSLGQIGNAAAIPHLSKGIMALQGRWEERQGREFGPESALGKAISALREAIISIETIGGDEARTVLTELYEKNDSDEIKEWAAVSLDRMDRGQKPPTSGFDFLRD